MSAHLRTLWKGFYMLMADMTGAGERKPCGAGMLTLSHTAERFSPTQIFRGGYKSEPLSMSRLKVFLGSRRCRIRQLPPRSPE